MTAEHDAWQCGARDTEATDEACFMLDGAAMHNPTQHADDESGRAILLRGDRHALLRALMTERLKRGALREQPKSRVGQYDEVRALQPSSSETFCERRACAPQSKDDAVGIE